MKQIIYLDKQNEINSASQFDARNGKSDNQTVKIEKQINRSLNQIKKRQRKMKRFVTGSELMDRNLPGLMEFLKNRNATPVRPFLSIPESNNKNLNSFLSLFFSEDTKDKY